MKYPGAIDKPLGDNLDHQELMRSHDIVCAHTMCGSLAGTDTYFRTINGIGYVGTESHLGFGPYRGQVYGWTDMTHTADANLDGKYRVISFETADTGAPYPPWSGSDVPRWTDEQAQEIEDFLVWVCSKEAHANCPPSWRCHQVGIPAEMVPDSRPGRRGIAVHRNGIDSSPPFKPGWRVSGGEHWSTSIAKACPGDRRIAQLRDEILPRVRARLNPWPRRGETSARVGAMVVKLDLAGYYPGKRRDRADYFGYYTTEAVKRLQLAFDDTKADPDGVIGPLTWAHIEALPGKPPPPQKPGMPLADAWQRATGAAVRAGDAFIAAHPDMKAYAALLARQQEEWRAIFNLNH